MPLYQQLVEIIHLGEETEAMLTRAAKEGAEFFIRFNNERMKLALSLFAEDMKKALFEILFFLHVNDPKFAEHQFTETIMAKVNGVLKEEEQQSTCNLYVEGAMSGVAGLEFLNPLFKDEFHAFVNKELGMPLEPKKGFNPIYSVASLGSIGTVGHKKTASDLDLQVQYELSPFIMPPKELSDEKLELYLKKLIQFYAKKAANKAGVKQADLKDPEKKKKVMAVGHKQANAKFPYLYDIVIKKDRETVRKALSTIRIGAKVVNEIIDLSKAYQKVYLKKQRQQAEALLKRKIMAVQSYIQRKYPKAEVYLFAYSNDDYRVGNHGTTLESKEASGSAYELILNYETLMPGIQFSPLMPVHFLMPPKINANRKEYERIVDYMRFHFIRIYDKYKMRMVDLGSTPPLTKDYMMAHAGAIYWESFKASSGNLPKATLNLLRIEMLFDQRFNCSIIELIKSPRRLDEYIGEETADFGFQPVQDEDFFDNYGLDNQEIGEEDSSYAEPDEPIGAEASPEGMKISQILDMEKEFPFLVMDPWWLRYKALKIGFGPKNQTVKGVEERQSVSRIIDLGFALHMKVSDVFDQANKPGEEPTLRDKVMTRFLQKAFPAERRRFLENIFAGETQTVLTFEKDLKTIFKNCMDRVNQIVAMSGGEDKTNRQEFAIWYHYYEQNFEPPPNVVRRDILAHLKVPRGRLQIGYDAKKKHWFFKSIQKSKGASFFNPELAHLPDEVELYEHPSFLHGIAHCIQNDYYGVFNKGTLRETRTQLEFSVAHMKFEKASANQWGFIRPDGFERLVNTIVSSLPPQNYDYRDCINKERELTEVIICLNLLEYGRLSILSRDNLKVWRVDDLDHPQIEAKAGDFYQDRQGLFNHKAIHQTLRKFFEERNFQVTSSTQSRLKFWVNPNSVHSHHTSDKPALKEEEITREFEGVVISTHLV